MTGTCKVTLSKSRGILEKTLHIVIGAHMFCRDCRPYVRKRADLIEPCACVCCNRKQLRTTTACCRHVRQNYLPTCMASPALAGSTSSLLLYMSSSSNRVAGSSPSGTVTCTTASPLAGGFQRSSASKKPEVLASAMRWAGNFSSTSPGHEHSTSKA